MILGTTRYHLEQLKTVLLQLDDASYANPLPVLNQSTIGKHVRHILEFYQCLLLSLKTGHLNYDQRQRDLEMETQLTKGTSTIDAILQALTHPKENMELLLTADHSYSDTQININLKTSFHRELLYNVEHLIHHMAIIRIGIQSMESCIELNEEIGVASSTIRNRNLCAQ